MNENTQIEYKLTKDTFTNEDGITYTVYGISVLLKNDTTEIDKIADISTNLSFVEDLVEKFNTLGLHIVHFRDVVYDEICGICV